eukprot:4734065-Alexandrium_andersonii.AAC.1
MDADVCQSAHALPATPMMIEASPANGNCQGPEAIAPMRTPTRYGAHTEGANVGGSADKFTQPATTFHHEGGPGAL